MNYWLKDLKLELGDKIEIKGPVATPIEKIKDEYRFQLWYFAKEATNVISLIGKLRNDFKNKLDKDVREYIDVDPINMY